MNKLSLLTPLVALVLSFSGFSQNQIVVSGQVKDSETKESIPYCKVVALNGKDSIVSGGITDDKGFFKLPVSPGAYSLVFSFYGYLNDTISTGLLREESFLGVFKIRPDVVEVEGVEIKANARIELLDRDVRVITETDKKGATATKDVLNKLEGISYDMYSGTLKVDNDANIMILVNGVEKSQEYIQNLDPERLLRVETTRDPGGRYGLEGYTAILNVILKRDYRGSEFYVEEMQLIDIDPDRSMLHLLIGSIGGTYNYTRNDLNIYGGFKLEQKRFELDTDSKTEYADGLTVNENSDGIDPNATILQRDARYTLGFDYRINPKHMISFESNIIALPLTLEDTDFDYRTTVFSNDTLIDEYDFSSTTKNKKWDTYNSLFYIGEFNKYNKLNINYTYSNYRDFYSISSAQEGAYSREESGTNKKQYSRFYAEFDHVFSGKTSIQIGYGNTWRELNNSYDISQYDVFSSQTFNVSDEFGLTDLRHKLYSNFSWRLNNKWSTRVGLAAESSAPRTEEQKLNYLIYQPLFDLQFRASQKLNFKLKYRTSNSYPTIAQTNPFVSQLNPRVTSTGNPYLRPSTTHRFSLRVNILQGLLALEPYYNYSNDMIARVGELGADNVFDFRFENVESYERIGGKLNFRKYLKFGLLIQSNVEVFQSTVTSTSNINQFIDWRGDADLIYIFQKSQSMLGLKYQRQQTKITTGLGYEKGDVDFWLLFYQQPLFKKKASVMFGYFLPLNLGTNYNQDSHVETTGFTMHTDNDVSLVKNMFIIEFSYRFNKGKSVKKTQKEIDQETEGGNGGLF